MEGLDVFQHYRLNPTDVDAVTYYLPRLIAGQPHGAEKFIHHVDIYSCEPKDLAAKIAPVPQAASSGDRFFFTTRKSKNGSKTQSVRTAGGGTWTVNATTAVKHAGVEVGERKNLSFRKKGKSTGWVMEEYRCLLPEATVADGVKVFCKIHLAQHPPDAARQESAAYMLQEPQREPVTVSTHAQKRPATAATADPHPSRPNKRMRGAVPVPAPATPSFLMYDEAARAMYGPLARTNFPVQDAVAVPAAIEGASASCEFTTTSYHSDVASSSHDMQRQAQAPAISSQSDVLESVKQYSQQQMIVPEAGSSIARSTSEEVVFEPLEPVSNLLDEEADGFDLEELMRMMEDDPIEVEPVTGASTGVEMGQQEPLYLDTLDQGRLEDMLQSDCPYPMWWRSEDGAMHNPASHDADKEKRYNAASDLDAPSLQGHDHLFKPRPCFFDPFEAALKAEEALEKEKRDNLHAGPLGGHNNFFSSASVH
ncbi:uncharacterized protein LOC119332638 [Triticum dicoccoides]|uniref:NAC domain-containing protein n=1 Tax=Triticum turgidum subsp. durum TaxID=4567 RepID=A0A9R0Z7L5_TRITD|nr:uncharacterized protein LOC119332625 [Triticum dicoccoides]XP_037461686.1 uncharacterized protein LOC119332625 [Triticum dicoccoides]XP_037461687.1 uncharacterized protein LOC119332625 [Triticum dicoccoides]XP_037461699.1 uncharacterized protein LOC119332638 [Triticum dicoccoides]XP_037461700.1 uncharacterized protein LOC119332638 [Triticum dicoccoides]VAI72773.1 unnamed protein product [Triticum turgidum subsp. durum]VAI72778.1 unnamed protein product [Triticum turgidum subsp. durum]